MQRSHPWPLCLLALLVLASCERARPPAQEAQAGATPEATRSSDPASAPEPSGGDERDAGAGAEFPALEIATLDGGAYDLAARRGKWVVVNFWATWCAPCLKEMPELSALDAMREHVEVVGLAYEDIERADLIAFLKKRPVVYPVAIVDVYDPPEDFATPRGLPMTYLIAPDGRVAKRFLGPVTAQEIEAAIAAAGGPEAAEA